MFLANDSKEHRESKVRRFLMTDPGISLLLAAVNFEWTVCRAVLFLSKRPNSELRPLMASYYSLDAYKELWRSEIVAGSNFNPLAVVVRNWSSVREAFNARNRFVHGRDRYTKNMATPHIEALLRATGYVDDYCNLLGSPLLGRMPTRRRTSKKS
ncbi:hypothetical protein SAMN05443247_02008 [Bradyrhizobium erythrophlei]|jgi:hypothetical protein|nr:hypothetical protein SAMN05443247_02008 [Bradyrhizobium erythrophlei]